MTDVIRDIVRILEQGRDAVLCTIINSEGSTPRTSGSSMLVYRGGAISGTVGGGLLEARVLQTARDLFERGGVRFLDIDLSGNDAAGSDMICGGRVRVMLVHLQPGREVLDAYTVVLAEMASGRRCVLVRRLQRSTTVADGIPDLILGRGGIVLAGRTAESLPMDVRRMVWSMRDAGILEMGSGHFLAVEPHSAPWTAVIVGAGHVGLFTAHTAAMVGFHTVVLDDRAEFANRERFPDAAEVRVLESFDNCVEGLDIGYRTFVAILTRGHLHDRDALARVLPTPAGYIGMIGSKRKRDAIYASLLEDGFTPEDLARVHSPIGLSIGGETPAEIAVSIVAEMIQVRAGMDHDKD